MSEILTQWSDSLPVSAGLSLAIIAVVALATFATRALPFLIFPEGKPIPPVVQYLGQLLTPAIIGMLVVYCLKGTDAHAAMPAVVSVLLVVVLHVWKRNNMLSIGLGTVVYMVLLQNF